MQQTRMHLTDKWLFRSRDWNDDCRRLAAQVSRLGICLLGAGMVGWAEPAAAQDGGAAELCRNGVVVPEPQDYPGLVADCAALLGALNQWEDSGLNWSAERPIRRWEGISVSDFRVTHLRLDNKRLSGAIPTELSQLASLGWLNLSNNDLTGEIPPELGQLVKLRKLDLSHNRLSGPLPQRLNEIGLRTQLLIEVLGFLFPYGSLEYLDLSHNQFTGPVTLALEHLIEQGSLGHLDLSHNRLGGPLSPGLIKILRQNTLAFVDFSGNEVCVPDSPVPLGDIPVCDAPPLPEPSEGRIYWTNLRSGEIQRANLDGSNVEVVVDGGGRPGRIALDPAAGKLYWTEVRTIWWTTGKIQRCDLDGSNLETLVVTGVEHPRGIALDLEGDQIYFTTDEWFRDRGEYVKFGKIWRANSDGSDVQTLLSEEIGNTNMDIAVDSRADKVYWTSGYSIQRTTHGGWDRSWRPRGHDPTGSPVDVNTVDLVLDVPGGRIYWVDGRGIHRAHLDDDSNVETLVTLDGKPAPRSLALDLNGGRMYWTDSQVIYRADLDGSHAEPFLTAAEHPGGIAFDPVGGKVYWTEPEAERIRRVDLDGTHVETAVSRQQRTPAGLALDRAGNRMYWTDPETNRIHRADLDGTHIEDLAGGLTAPGGIALDVPGGKMYWTNRDTSVIHRADLDGGNVENLAIPTDPERGEPPPYFGWNGLPALSGWNGMVGIALDLAAGRMYWMDWRFELNGKDMTYRIGRAGLAGTHAEVVFQHSLYTAGSYPRPGIGVGGIALDPVDGKMHSVLRSSLGVDWNSEGVPNIPGILHRSNLDGSDIEDLGITLEYSDAIAVDVVEGRLYWSPGSSIHWTDLQGNKKTLLTGVGRVGSIALDFYQPETLVSTFSPESNLPALSGLAPNYPNPFNAGTRLVYRLADPGPVRLEVYNVLGQRVRTLVDETQKAGSYQVHWDARDQGGTPAAAGVYVTRLQYPGGEQTRRLLLLK